MDGTQITQPDDVDSSYWEYHGTMELNLAMTRLKAASYTLLEAAEGKNLLQFVLHVMANAKRIHPEQEDMVIAWVYVSLDQDIQRALHWFPNSKSRVESIIHVVKAKEAVVYKLALEKYPHLRIGVSQAPESKPDSPTLSFHGISLTDTTQEKLLGESAQQQSPTEGSPRRQSSGLSIKDLIHERSTPGPSTPGSSTLGSSTPEQPAQEQSPSQPELRRSAPSPELVCPSPTKKRKNSQARIDANHRGYTFNAPE